MNALPRIAVKRAEAAAMLGVSEDTIRRAVRAGDLRAKKTGKDKHGVGVGHDLFLVADLQAWFEGLADA